MIDVNTLTFDGIELHKWVSGFQSKLAGHWAEHKIPGQRGALQEDLGDGVLDTKVVLQFAGPTARDDYNKVMKGLKKRRGEFTHPIRGPRPCILFEAVESMDFVKQGNAIRLELTIKEAILSPTDQFQSLPSSFAQGVLSKAALTQANAEQYKSQMFVKFPLNTTIRSKILSALDRVNGFVRAANTYASVGLRVFQEGDLGLDLVNQLQALPGLVSEAETQLSQLRTPTQIQPILLSMEECLYAATQFDQALRANLPPPIITLVSQSPGQSIYSFVEAWYPEKTRAQQLALIPILLKLNRGIRNPSLIPMGFRLLRPAS